MVAFIHFYEVEPAQQQRVFRLLWQFYGEVVRQRVGFLAARPISFQLATGAGGIERKGAVAALEVGHSHAGQHPSAGFGRKVGGGFDHRDGYLFGEFLPEGPALAFELVLAVFD